MLSQSTYRACLPVKALLWKSCRVANMSTMSNGSRREDDPAQAMLHATLPFIHEHGWSVKSLSHGAKSLGYPSVAHGMIPGGEAGLVDAFLSHCHRQFNLSIAEKQASGQLEGFSKRERVRELTAMRLKMTMPYAKRWPEALAIMARPSNLPNSLGHLADIVDDVWYYAGDRSADMHWYSKRASLAAIYSSTEIYMTQDVSPNYDETLRFLDRRLEEAAWLDASSRQLYTMLEFGARSLVGVISQRGNRG